MIIFLNTDKFKLERSKKHAMIFHIISGPISCLTDIYDYNFNYTLELGGFLKFFKIYTLFIVKKAFTSKKYIIQLIRCF